MKNQNAGFWIDSRAATLKGDKMKTPIEELKEIIQETTERTYGKGPLIASYSDMLALSRMIIKCLSELDERLKKLEES